MNYMIGEQVIYMGVICTICAPDHNRTDLDAIWIDNPEKGYKHTASEINLKPFVPSWAQILLERN